MIICGVGGRGARFGGRRRLPIIIGSCRVPEKTFGKKGGFSLSFQQLHDRMHKREREGIGDRRSDGAAVADWQ